MHSIIRVNDIGFSVYGGKKASGLLGLHQKPGCLFVFYRLSHRIKKVTVS